MGPADGELIDLGDGHTARLSHYEGEVVGCRITHKTPDGRDCGDFIPWTGRAWARSFNGRITSWEVISEDPLTLSPSLQCRVCGDHGFVRNGRWVRA